MHSKTTFPLYLSGIESITNDNIRILAGDLRAEQSVLAVYISQKGSLELLVEQSYPTADFQSAEEMIEQFCQDTQQSFDRISLGVPGPIILGKCETTHLPWAVDSEAIKSRLKVNKIFLINDLEATAYSLHNLQGAEVVALHKSEKVIKGNMALLAPGNGLGEAGLFWDGTCLRPFATEGGHTEFSPRNSFEVDFYQYLNKIYGIVSWESILSKKGLYNIYRFLRDIGRHEETPTLSKRIHNEDFVSLLKEIGTTGDSRLITLTLEWFAEFLAREATHLSLKLKATGGLVITGEVAEQLRTFIDGEKFYKDFIHSDKMTNVLKDIPIYFVFNVKSTLLGSAYYGAFSEKEG